MAISGVDGANERQGATDRDIRSSSEKGAHFASALGAPVAHRRAHVP